MGIITSWPWKGAGRRRSGRPGRPSDHLAAEEVGAQVLDGRDHQGPVQEVVVLLARGFGDQQAAVAGRTVQEATLVRVLRVVLGANWVVRAQAAQFQRGPQMTV